MLGTVVDSLINIITLKKSNKKIIFLTQNLLFSLFPSRSIVQSSLVKFFREIFIYVESNANNATNQNQNKPKKNYNQMKINNTHNTCTQHTLNAKYEPTSYNGNFHMCALALPFAMIKINHLFVHQYNEYAK